MVKLLPARSSSQNRLTGGRERERRLPCKVYTPGALAEQFMDSGK